MCLRNSGCGWSVTVIMLRMPHLCHYMQKILAENIVILTEEEIITINDDHLV